MPSRPKLAVILGAGASHDVCPDDGPIKQDRWKPPLVNTMFEGGALDEVLSQHPEAQALMSSVRTRVRGGGVFEEILRDYTNDLSPHIQRQMRFVPIALHEFFYRVSNTYTSEAINYSHLVNSTVGKGIQTAYVTLNYDTLLEMSLTKITGAGFGNIESYVSSPDWILVKLHGSVGWGYPWNTAERTTSLRHAARANNPPPRHSELIRVGLHPGEMYADDTLFYPALSLPVTGKYVFVCPPSHVAALRSFLQDCENFLFIGFSANDRDLIELLAGSIGDVTLLRVVTGQGDHDEVVERLIQAFSQLRDPALFRQAVQGFNLGFTRYLETDHGIDRLVASLVS